MTRRQRRELERERQAQLQRENARELLSQAPNDSGFSGRANAAYGGGGGYNDAGYNGSHGCVNMKVEDAKWIYDWAPEGTTVVSHY